MPTSLSLSSYVSDQEPRSFSDPESRSNKECSNVSEAYSNVVRSIPVPEPIPEALDLAFPTSNARWWKLLPVNLMKAGGMLLVVPALTNLKTDFFEGDTNQATLVQSIADSSRAIFTLLVTTQLGKLSDAIGRRPLIVASCFGSLFPLLCLAFSSSNIYSYFAAYALAGLLGGAASPAAQAYVADCSPPHDRARIFGIQGASMNAVIMLLPGLTTLIDYHYGREALFLVAVGCLLLAVFAAACLLPESLPKDKKQPLVIASMGWGSMAQTLRKLFKRRGGFLWYLALLRFLKDLSAMSPSFLFLAWRSLLELTDTDFSMVMTISGFCGVLVQSGVVKIMLRCQCSPLTMIVFSLCIELIYNVCNCLISQIPSKQFVFALSAFFTLARVYSPAFMSMATQNAEGDQGFILGAFASIGNITSFVSPLLMAALYQMDPSAPFVLSAFLTVVCLAYCVRLRRRMLEDEDGLGTLSAPSEIEQSVV